MKSIDEYMAFYSEMFQEKPSKLLVKSSVLLAFFAIVALLWSASFFLLLALSIGVIAFYYSLNDKTAIAGALLIGACWAIQLIISFMPVILVLLLVLAIAGQIYAQSLEGEKLSIKEQLMFQITGPLWAVGPRNLMKFDLY